MNDKKKHALRSERGMALVLTLMVLALITAMVTEFAYGVFTTTSALHNWETSQRLSFVARSGVTLALKTISDMRSNLYRFPEKLEIPVENILEGFDGRVVVKVEDENSRFNLNAINRVWPKNTFKAYDSFKRLLKNLSLDETIANKVAGWTNMNSPLAIGLTDFGDGAKNDYMDSIDELLLMKGVDSETYEKLLPYATVYGFEGISYDPRININTASIPVIMSLDDRITEDMAENVVRQRKLERFKDMGKLQQISGFDTVLSSISDMIGVEPSNFHITVVAEENKIKRVIETVVTVDASGRSTIKYWKET